MSYITKCWNKTLFTLGLPTDVAPDPIFEFEVEADLPFPGPTWRGEELADEGLFGAVFPLYPGELAP